MVKGAFTLIVTPFDKNYKLDEDGFRELIRRQVDSGIHGIAPLGVTGESPALTDAEIQRVVEICVDEAGGKCLIAPDTCSCNLEQTINRLKLYSKLGCDLAVVYVPFLVLPKPDGVLEFYKRINDVTDIPVLIHNAPGRVGINVEPSLYSQLARMPNIVGTKDGNKLLDHLAKVIYVTKEQDFGVFTGKDTTAYPIMMFGGSGVFAVAGNIVPEVMRDIVDFSLKGDREAAAQLHYDYYELFEALRFETNPMAAKEALGLMGFPGQYLRLPLTRLSESKRNILKEILHKKGLV
jgi:4-hydroxy-tetrahydrodipicolinate synthase